MVEGQEPPGCWWRTGSGAQVGDRSWRGGADDFVIGATKDMLSWAGGCLRAGPVRPDRFSGHPAGWATLGSRGRPSTFSPTMLRWIWDVPPQIVSEREKKNADIIRLTG